MDSSVEIDVSQVGDDWRVRCVACPTWREYEIVQDLALWAAWSHHQNVHPRDVMVFSRS